jgi:N,N-dimethylformamidase beta subunit-like protein
MVTFAFFIAVLAVAIFMVAIGLLSLVAWDFIRFRRGIYHVHAGPVSGYADRYSFTAGDTIDLYVHSSEPVVLTIFRLAQTWEPVGDRVRLDKQLQSSSFDRRKGMSWTKAATAIDSTGFRPGLYRFMLRHECDESAQFAIPIIIKDRKPNPLSVILATHTWDAYNTFGGISHYENHHIWGLSRLISTVLKRPNWGSMCVPSRRPNALFSDEARGDDFDAPYTSFLVRNEIQFLVFLARHGYEYGVYDDGDLANDPAIQRAKVLAFCGHSEYWTDNMFFAFERFLAHGGKVFRTNAGMEGKALSTPLGLNFGPRPSQTISNALVGTHTDSQGQFTAAPFRVLRPDHWVFAGTGLQSSDVFGKECKNRPSFDVPGHQHLRDRTDLEGQPQKGASGFFTSKVGPGSGAFSKLATGMNPRGPAHMVYRNTPEGGWIFNASSISFNGALLCDKTVERIVCNLMDDATVSGFVRREGEPSSVGVDHPMEV